MGLFTSGEIKQGQVVTKSASIDSSVTQATFEDSWEGSNLNLVLYTPSGVKIDPKMAASDPNIIFIKESNFAYYIVKKPQKGVWKLVSTGVDVPKTEIFTAAVYLISNLKITAKTNKPSYLPNELIKLTTTITQGNAKLFKKVITATIIKPNNSKETIRLYDNGKNGDNKANDGVYTAIYKNTNLMGVYKIITTSNGTIGTGKYERTAFNQIVVTKPDKTPPIVKSTTPYNLKTGYSKTSNIIIKFSEIITSSKNYNKITVKNLKTNKYLKIYKSTGNALTIKTGTRSPNKWYMVTIPTAAISDTAGNKLLRSYTFKFKTGT